jgi:Kef-type K+ transport system membrane component KefB
MIELSPVWRFMQSRSGRGFLLHLSLCAALSVAVGYGFYHFSLNWFKEHKSSEKVIALQLVDAFVTNYSERNGISTTSSARSQSTSRYRLFCAP